MAGEGCTSDLVATEIPQPFGQNFVDQYLLDWEMAWPFLFEDFGEPLEGTTGLQIIWIDRNAHGNSPIPQGVGFPLTIVEVHAKRGRSICVQGLCWPTARSR